MTETERITNEVIARNEYRQQLEKDAKILGAIAAGLDLDAARAILPSTKKMFERQSEIIRDAQFDLLGQIPADDPLEVNEILAFGYPYGSILMDGPLARFKAWLKKPVSKSVFERIAWALLVASIVVFFALWVTK